MLPTIDIFTIDIILYILSDIFTIDIILCILHNADDIFTVI